MRNEQFLDDIYNDVKALGLVSNQCDFSVMCGRTATWFSAIKARRLNMTTDAALTLSYNIRTRATDMVDAKVYVNALRLSERLVEEAQAQIGRKLQHILIAHINA